MEQSASTAKLFAALSKAQAKIKGAIKDSSNPFFNSKYADLESVWSVCREPLAEHELCVAQTLGAVGDAPALITTLGHSSGEFIRGTLPLILGKKDMQALGSAITYARRYSLAAMVGVIQEDDDAEGQMPRQSKATASPTHTGAAARSEQGGGPKVATRSNASPAPTTGYVIKTGQLTGKVITEVDTAYLDRVVELAKNSPELPGIQELGAEAMKELNRRRTNVS